MAISTDTSRRFTMLRFPLIVGVVFVHAYGFKAGFAGGEIGPSQIHPAVFLVETYLSQVVARITIPLFYFISGFLFFASFGGTAREYVNKLMSRARTLLIPFLFWNLLTMLILAFAQANPHTAVYFAGTSAPISSFGPYDYLNAVFGLTRSPIAYQFWFIRDLMVLVLLSPLLYLLMRRFPWPTIFLLAGLWLSGYGSSYVPSPEAALFFFIGGALAYSDRDLAIGNGPGKGVFLIYIIISVLDLGLQAGQGRLGAYVHKIGLFPGTVSAIWIAGILGRADRDGKNGASPRRRFAGRSARLIESLSPFAFFIFAAHEPLLTAIRKLCYHVYKPSDPSAVLAIYLTAPVLTILICIFLYLAARRTMPVLTRTICGGR